MEYINTKHLSYMKIAESFSMNSPCRRKKTGAVILSTTGAVIVGYNELPRGMSTDVCKIENCPREGQKRGDWTTQKVCPVIHAERLAIFKAARSGVSTEGATMFCTYKPCMECAHAIVAAGIKTVYYTDEYTDSQPVEYYLDRMGVTLERLIAS